MLLLHATGLRRIEASQLKLADIVSKHMVIHVHKGKNSRDRELPLTPKLLEALRAYSGACKVKPKEERPITDKAVWRACRERARAGQTVENASASCRLKND